MKPQALQQSLEASLAQRPGSAPAAALRREAMAAFAESGYPTRKDEDWRYTDLKPIVSADFDPLPGPLRGESIARARRSLERSALAGEGMRVVFVDGQLVPELCSSESPTGLDLRDLDEAWQHRARPAADRKLLAHPLAALNTAFASGGSWLRVAENTRVAQPVQLVFIDSGQARSAPQPRIMLDLASGAGLTVLQHFLGDNPGPGWTNVVTEITQERDSELQLYRFQEHGSEHYHTSMLNAELARDARLKLGYIDLGGRLVRNDAHVDLAEPGARCEMFGVFLAVDGQHVDNHTRIDHSAPATTSDEAFRGIVGDRGRGVFNGKVVVHKDAQKVDASQSSDNLLLSDRGEIDTKPELEIYADDVKCSHGATVGELDEGQLFYLRARGIDEAAARGLLTFAFANHVLRRIDLAQVRERVTMRVAGHLPDHERWSALI